MTDNPLVEIRLTPEFQRRLRNLAKKYRQIQIDLAPILEQIKSRKFPGDQIPRIDFTVMKVRIKNSDSRKGKSGGYRLIYWISLPDLVILLDIYSKSEQQDSEIDNIRQIIKGVDL